MIGDLRLALGFLAGAEIRYAVRSLRRSPGFVLAVVATLALTIGANVAVFTLVRGVLLRPLPYAEPERLVSVYERNARDGVRLASYPTFRDWHREAAVFDGLAFVRGRTEILHGAEGPQQVLAGYVSEDFFRVTGEVPRLGRTFAPEELTGAAGPVAVLSHELWRRQFGGDRSVIGRGIPLAGSITMVIGVMPPGFTYPSWADLWLPMASLPASERGLLEQRGLHVDSRVVGRLAPGITPVRAAAVMDGLAARLAAAYPETGEGWTRVRLTSLTEETLGDATTRLVILQAAVLAVLLIGCSNLVNLCLARGVGRARELGVRVALGASRGRIVGQLVAEGALLVLAGSAAGLLLAAWALEGFRATAGDGVLPRLAEVTIDGGVLGFVLVVAGLVTLAVGLLPALRVTHGDLAAAVGEGHRQAGPGRRAGRARSLLIAAQLALATVLLIGAGLLLRSFIRLGEVPLGFQPERILTLRVVPPSTDHPDRLLLLYRQLRAAALEVPGVESAALSNHVPLTGASMDTRVMPEGWRGEGQVSALFRTVSPEYFGTMGIPVIRGRPLEARDMSGASRAVLVNEAFARRYWPGADPVGRRLTVFKSVQSQSDFGEPLDGEVVGVTADVHHFSPEAEPVPEVYLPYPRNPPHWISLVVRTRSRPDEIIGRLRRAVLAVEPELPVGGSVPSAGFVTLQDLLARGRAPRTLQTALLGGFAGAALLLALIGIWSVVAYTVSQRRQEIAVRVALGADRATILALVLRRTLLLCALGIVAGAVGAVLLTRFLAGLLFGVGTTDPLTFAGVAALLAAVAVTASWLPARRATRIDPLTALRSE